MKFLETTDVRPAPKICWLLLLSTLLCISVAVAQDNSEEPTEDAAVSAVDEQSNTTSDADTSESPVASAKPWITTDATARPVAPDVYLLPDEYGKLRKVLGFSYEDFFEAWNREEGTSVVKPPSYVLDAINITGNAEQSYARLRVEFEITVHTEAWIDIPLQLPEFIVQQNTIEGQAEGECLVYDQQHHGLVVWLSGKAGKKRKLVLEGLAKLKLQTGADGLELQLPRATSSQLSLTVPGSKSRFESTPEIDLSTKALDDGNTEVCLLGQANPLRLQWTSENEGESSQSAVVEVVGQTTVRINRRRAFYDATLRINSFGSPMEQIRVRLPLESKWDAGQSTGDYKVRLIDVPEDSNQGQVVEIQTLQPRSKPWRVRLAAEQPLAVDSSTTECNVGGFEVLEAFRQSGTVTLEVDDQLQAYFETDGDIDQVPLKESSANPSERSALARFAYASFPWRLAVFASPRQRRVSVQPRYELTINSEDAQLEAEYKYLLTGAQIFSLQIDPKGWTLTDDPIESGGSIDRNRIVVTREGHLVLPLVDPDVQEVRLNLTLRKNSDLGNNSFPLPEPLGAFVVDGELLVGSDESLRITPKLGEMTGLTITPPAEETISGPSIDAAKDKENQIALRTFLPRPEFVAEVAIQPREVTVTGQTLVEMDLQRVRVRQQLLYQAKYRPVSQLSLRVPEELWENDSLRVMLEGQELPVGLGAYRGEGVSEDEFENLSGNEPTLRQLVVSLPRLMQNDIPLEITYEVPAVELEDESLTPVVLPLMTPTDRLLRHEATVVTSQPILATANPRSVLGEWAMTSEGGESNLELEGLQLQTDENLSFLAYYVELESLDKVQLATLERAWLQSWITRSRRQERAVFRFRTPYSSAFVQLPDSIENNDVEVLLNGIAWQHEILPNNRLEVEIPVERQDESHTLELRYLQISSLPSWGKLQSNFPRLECRTSSAPIYWQMILPRGWQVTASPSELIADYWLGWKNYRWGRQPTLSQAHLERFTGATSLVSPTPVSSEYVYRAFEIPVEIQVVVIRQAWLFLAGALIAFGLGMLWLNTSFARSGVFWLGLSLTLLTGVFTYPEVSLLAAQSIFVGGLLVLITYVLRHIFVLTDPTRFTGGTYPLESPTEITETWQLQHSHRSDMTETTEAIRSGGPTS